MTDITDKNKTAEPAGSVTTPTAGTARAWLKNLSRPRGGSRAHLVPYAAVGALVVIVIAGLSVRSTHRKSRAPQGAAAHAAPTVAVAPVVQSVLVTAGASASAAPAANAATAPANAPTAATVQQTPPPGLVAGQILETVADADQFGQYTQSSAHVIPSPATSWHSVAMPAGTPAWQETFDGWFQLPAPSRIAILRRGAGPAARNVTAEIDGASVGPALGFGVGSETATLPLEAGWHHFVVTAMGQSSDYQPSSTAIQLEVGDGVTAPSTVVPYAVLATVAPTSSAPTSAPVFSAPPASAEVPAKPAPTSTAEAH